MVPLSLSHTALSNEFWEVIKDTPKMERDELESWHKRRRSLSRRKSGGGKTSA